MIFWNVAGLATIDDNMWKKLKENEIISLTKTWMEKRSNKIQEQLEDYEVKYVEAKKTRKKEEQEEKCRRQ